MLEDWTLSEAQLLERLRKRSAIFADIVVEQSVMLQDVDMEFRAVRRKRADLGLLNHALNLFLETRNPFEPQRMRKPKMEAAATRGVSNIHSTHPVPAMAFGAEFGLTRAHAAQAGSRGRTGGGDQAQRLHRALHHPR